MLALNRLPFGEQLGIGGRTEVGNWGSRVACLAVRPPSYPTEIVRLNA